MKKWGYLKLEDGTILTGQSFGYEKSRAGEVVFTTSMVGYPESLTDPSYHGQILVFSYPLIGNYGVPKPRFLAESCLANFESERIWVRGVIVAEYIDTPSHYSSSSSLADWLKKEKIPALTGIDTRALILKLREKGVMRGQIVFAKRESQEWVDINSLNLVKDVSINTPILYKAAKKRFAKPILLYDCGVKHGIIRHLLAQNFSILRVPWNWQPAPQEEFSGVVISNGPGDPVMADQTIETVSKLLHRDIPIFGICLGNQILALAAGGQTYKLKYGHRASNQPVQDQMTRRAYVTTQNHGFAVDIKSLSKDWKEWFVNLNDATNEGIRHRRKPFFTIQFHAEAAPGPQDSFWIFDHFARTVEAYEKG